jgi:hypothetical protein
MRFLTGFVALMVLNSSAFAGGSNCRLIVQTHFKNGKKKVSVEETGAASHADCKMAAQQRELDSGDEDIQRVKVVFGYRELSILGTDEADAQE